jgi:hypothetical protein
VESFHHICQDAVCQGEFISTSGKRVWYGAVSDGCSSALGSQHGARFIVSSFSRLVEELYNTGLREAALLSGLALGLTEAMAAYEPCDEHSNLYRYNETIMCSELEATLQAYVADGDRILLLLAGDGFLSLNGKLCWMDQSGGATYPVVLLTYPRTLWQEKLGYAYVFVSLPTERIDTVMLATDGLQNAESFACSNDPLSFIERVRKEASTWPCPRHRSDDTSAVVLKRTGKRSRDPLPTEAVDQIANEVGRRTFQNILLDAGKPKMKVIRQQDEVCLKQSFDLHLDIQVSTAAGITLFGLGNDSSSAKDLGDLSLLASKHEAQFVDDVADLPHEQLIDDFQVEDESVGQVTKCHSSEGDDTERKPSEAYLAFIERKDRLGLLAAYRQRVKSRRLQRSESTKGESGS